MSTAERNLPHEGRHVPDDFNVRRDRLDTAQRLIHLLESKVLRPNDRIEDAIDILRNTRR